MAPDRYARRYALRPAHDARPEAERDPRADAERDCDRVLYCSAFRRLAGVTQVVGPIEGHVFHNRLTHTLEVAQIARRLAEKFVRQQPDRAKAIGGIDPNVVEAAARIHDIGHPPFGHVAEEELDQLTAEKNPDGFEGNAQSFRIVVRLAAHRTNYRGLDLTRATLNAVLKYPWHRDATNPSKLKKFGAYLSDGEDFEFAREGWPNDVKCPEAQIMDHADAIAYSVHDLDDFYRAGLIPMDRLTNEGTGELDAFLAEWKQAKDRRGVSEDEIDAQTPAIKRWLSVTYVQVPHTQTWHQSARLRTITAAQIAEFVNPVRLNDDRDGAERVLHVPDEKRVLLRFCQRLVWRYVIHDPRLATQQAGQRAIIRNLFRFYESAILEGKGRIDLLPPRFQQAVEGVTDNASAARLASDVVASLTDAQAVAMHRRVTGTATGTVRSSLW